MLAILAVDPQPWRDAPKVGKPAAYVDKLLIEGKGSVHHIWGCDHYKTMLNAHKFKQVYKKRTDSVKDAMNAVTPSPWTHFIGDFVLGVEPNDFDKAFGNGGIRSAFGWYLLAAAYVSLCDRNDVDSFELLVAFQLSKNPLKSWPI
jgi:hypothetical protein